MRESMGTKRSKKGSYIIEGGILAAASILVRVIGLAYRIPVTRILGPVGNSYYSAAYEVYSMVLLISSFSLPLAVSKLVSARMAKGQVRSAIKIFRCTLIFALVSGGIGSLLIYFGAGFSAMCWSVLRRAGLLCRCWLLRFWWWR